MFAIEYEVYANLLVSFRYFELAVKENIKLVDTFSFVLDGIGPQGIAIEFIKAYWILPVAWNFDAVFECLAVVVGLKLHLIDHAVEFLLVLRPTTKLLPTWGSKEVVVLSIPVCCAGCGIILSNDAERLRGNLPVFPFEYNVP